MFFLLGGASGSTALPPLPVGAKVVLIGDSILHYNTYATTGAAKEFSESWRGEMTWLTALDPRFRYETWRDITRVWGPFTGTNGTLGSNPFSVTNGSPTVTVTHAGHAMATGAGYLGGAEYVFSGATAVGGLTLNGGYKVVTVPTSSTFTITAGSNANATTTGGGTVAYKQRLASTVPQYFGAGGNWATAADHTDGALDILQAANGFPSSNLYSLTGADVAIVGIGANDINSSKAAAGIQANISSIVTLLLTKVQRVILLTVRPRGAPATDTLPNNPFATTNASATVVVSHPGHAYDSGQQVTFTGASAVGGLTITGPYTILATNFSADTYQFTHGGTASSSATGGGTGVTAVNTSTNFVYPINDARWTVLKAVNDFIRNAAWGPRVTVVDCDGPMLDATVTVNTTSGITGAAKRSYLVDGVHPTPLGAYYNARYGILPVLQSLVSPGTWFESDPTAATNYMRNGPLAGTGGLTSTGCTGTCSDAWLAQRTTGSTLTAVASKSTVGPGTDKTTFTLTSGAGGGVDTIQYRPGSAHAYNRTGTGTSVTFNVLTSGANPTVRVSHNALSNGHPFTGCQITFANASATVQGVTLNGTWTCSSGSNATTSNAVYEFVATGQTASGTGSSAVTTDWTYSGANVFPLNSWVRYGCYVELSAWDKWRGVQMQMITRNASTGVLTYRAGRSYDENMRYMPSEAWSGWLLGDPVKLDAEALASVTNIFFALNFAVENSAAGTTTGTIAFSRPFLRAATDPTTVWL